MMIIIHHGKTDGGARSDPVHKSAKNFYTVFLIACGDNRRLARTTTVKLALDLIDINSYARWLTGYIRGGCSPIGMKKSFPTYFHSSINDFDRVFVSAGVRGLQFKIAPADLIKYTPAPMIAHTIFGSVCIIGMRRTKSMAHIIIIA